MPDFSDPNTMAAFGGLAAVLQAGGAPRYDPQGHGITGGSKANALALLAAAGMGGAVGGAKGAQDYQKENIANQSGQLGLQLQQASQPLQLQTIKDLGNGITPGSLAGSSQGSGQAYQGLGTGPGGQLTQADQYGLAMLQTAKLSYATTRDPKPLMEAYKSLYEHNPKLAGAVKLEEQGNSVVQSPNGPVMGNQVPGFGSGPSSAYGSLAPQVQPTPQPQSMQPPQSGQGGAVPISTSQLQAPVSLGSNPQPQPPAQIPGNPFAQSSTATSQQPPSTASSADATGMPKYKFDPFSKVSTDQAGEFGKADMKVNDGYSERLQGYAQSEQRLNTVAQALKQVQSGGLATNKAEIANLLQGLGVNIKSLNMDDPAAVYDVLHEQGINTLEQLKSLTSGSKITNGEFTRIGQFMNNPNLPPSTNQQLLGEAIGAIHYDKSMIGDWNKMGGLGNRNAGGYTERPNDFERNWQLNNKMIDFVNDAKGQIGPLKGMNQQNAAPDIQGIVDELRKRGHKIQ